MKRRYRTFSRHRLTPISLCSMRCWRTGMSVLSTCVTKQTKDIRYSEVEHRWCLSFGPTHDDAVCPGKRVGSWINACSSFRVTKRRRCLYRIFAVSLGCHGQRAIVGSTATRKLVRRGFWTGAVSHTGALTQLQSHRHIESGRTLPVQLYDQSCVPTN